MIVDKLVILGIIYSQAVEEYLKFSKLDKQLYKLHERPILDILDCKDSTKCQDAREYLNDMYPVFHRQDFKSYSALLEIINNHPDSSKLIK